MQVIEWLRIIIKSHRLQGLVAGFIMASIAFFLLLEYEVRQIKLPWLEIVSSESTDTELDKDKERNDISNQEISRRTLAI